MESSKELILYFGDGHDEGLLEVDFFIQSVVIPLSSTVEHYKCIYPSSPLLLVQSKSLHIT